MPESVLSDVELNASIQQSFRLTALVDSGDITIQESAAVFDVLFPPKDGSERSLTKGLSPDAYCHVTIQRINEIIGMITPQAIY